MVIKSVNLETVIGVTSKIPQNSMPEIAFAGKSNVGKSSLLNLLIGEEKAIVTDIAGTTRDVIKENLDLGVAITLIDTAGIREDENIDKVEEIGIEYSKQSAQEADMVLFLYDANAGLTEEDKQIYNIIKDKTHIIVANKIDLIEDGKFTPIFENTAKLSTYSKDGLDELKEKNLPFKEEYVYREGEALDTKLGRQALRYFLSLPKMPTALLCANDMVALGVINEARSMNIDIPDSLSVCGFDHVLDEFLPVPLTTVEQNIPKIAEELFYSLTEQPDTPAEKIVDSIFIPGKTCARVSGKAKANELSISEKEG